MNTQDNSSVKVYLVSFGNSDKYVLRDTEAGERSLLTRIEGELNDYLRAQFPDETFAYFTSPKVEEVGAEGLDSYSAYPVLDDKAVEDIKRVLSKEVENLEANDELDSDAPFANVNPAAADLPHII